MLVGPAPSVAGTITAADSFRVASNLAMEVHLLHDANFSQATGSPIRRKERVLPRHVLQMARTVLRKANMLAWIYGSDTVPMGPMPTRKVRHDDVHATLQSSVWVIEGLRPIFNIQTDVVPAPLDASKTSNDVYSVLDQISQMIDGLGIPETVPNDLYQLVDAIVFELETIARHYNARSALMRPRDNSKSFRDIHAETLAIADALEGLVKVRPKLTPVDGIIPPYHRSGAIDADHVSYALSDLLADVVAMKATTGKIGDIRAPKQVSGMTVSHVHQRLAIASEIVALLAKEL